MKNVDKKFSLNGEIKLVEKDVYTLGNGVFKVNANFYLCSFKEVDKYNEKRYIFQKFDLDKFKADIKHKKFKNLKEYVEDFKLEVIEDSTYKIKALYFLKK